MGTKVAKTHCSKYTNGKRRPVERSISQETCLNEFLKHASVIRRETEMHMHMHVPTLPGLPGGVFLWHRFASGKNRMDAFHRLGRQYPYSSLSREDFLRITPSFSEQHLGKGAYLLVPEQIAEKIGFIHTGTADLFVGPPDDYNAAFTRISDNSFFGIISLLSGGKYRIYAVCREPVICYYQKKEDFMHSIHQHTKLMAFFYDIVLQRMPLIYERPKGLHHFNNPQKDKTPLPIKSLFVDKALKYIKSNYSDPLTLHEVAKKTGISKFNLSRHFKANAGCSFKSYLNRQRIIAAQALMVNPEQNITEACFAVGFNDLSYFSRIFKQRVGLTPSEYRRKNLRYLTRHP